MIHYNEINDDEEDLNHRTKKVAFKHPPRMNGNTLTEAYIVKGTFLGTETVAVFTDNPATSDKDITQLVLAEGLTEDQALYQVAKNADNLHPILEVTY